MKSQNSFKVMALSVVASIVLVGCGSDTTEVSTPSVTPQESITVTGVAIDPELQNAKVFLDINENSQYDAGEPFVMTDAEGRYTLDISAVDIGKPLVVEGGIDRVTKEEFKGKLTLITTSESGEQYITPLTTLVEKYKRENSDATLEDVKAEVATKLGLADVTDLDKDILKDTRLLKLALRVEKVAQGVSRASGEEIDAIYAKIANGLTKQGFDDALEGIINGDINKTSLDFDKLKDLNRELKNIDHASLSYEEFALSVDNIDRNITRTRDRNELKHDLFDDAEMIVENQDEVKSTQAQKVLEKLGLDDKDGLLKEKLLNDKEVDFKNNLFENIATKLKEKGFKIPKGIADKFEKRPEPQEGNDDEMQGEQTQGANQEITQEQNGEMEGQSGQGGNQQEMDEYQKSKMEIKG